ncbi:cytochrome P450 [Halalkalibacterium halodurans]|uniref:Fatty acid alpha hydroxylase n=1 Tax=Halalkalibacterium halodurans (strain ATCC BAA-125 / DSM 18197 / FERM 7344 / JCM 9153 / C-125) TaxID=272558 RepID=Q9KC17_HALH5|nr:cytochrome P450 [Halalkalibacterium halodurans]MED4170974.1 cytochrome P450 [Halalkalibacterium halodurans]BAB05476.1 fatty acid alpha hydroxylase [Halalkalibacterium halodurans C-125]
MKSNDPIPKDSPLDHTMNLMREGYEFLSHRMERFQTDLFETRVMGQKVLCIRGAEAVKLFYDPERFKRHRATPKRIQKSLFGENAIQTMDDKAHLHRKQLFLSMMKPEDEQELARLTHETWRRVAEGWKKSRPIVLFDEAKRVLCQVACEWAEVPLKSTEIDRRAEDFHAMVDAFGAVGPRHWRGRKGRRRTERWIQSIIHQVRTGSLQAREGSPLYKVSYHRELNGKLLDERMAAIELINVLRPIVAIATFISFAAIALQEHPEWQERLKNGSNEEFHMFVQEVRRYYPFAPLIGAKVRKSFTWKGVRFKKGRLVFLDMYGTNHDPKLWDEPDAFRPERFQERKDSLYDFIPQGGGDPTKGHRCPGEGITVEVMKTTMDFLVNDIDYDVPDQDISYSLSRMPTRPESGYIMANIERKYEHA